MVLLLLSSLLLLLLSFNLLIVIVKPLQTAWNKTRRRVTNLFTTQPICLPNTEYAFYFDIIVTHNTGIKRSTTKYSVQYLWICCRFHAYTEHIQV